MAVKAPVKMPVKVGDKYRIVKNTCFHGFRIGQIVTITKVTCKNWYKAKGRLSKTEWTIGDADIEPIKGGIAEWLKSISQAIRRQ